MEDAVESLGGRVTVGEVAARAGVRLNEAEAALNALAADSLGTLQVNTCDTTQLSDRTTGESRHTLTCLSQVQRPRTSLTPSSFVSKSCLSPALQLVSLLKVISFHIASCVIAENCGTRFSRHDAVQVSGEGDVLYVLRANFRATIRQRSWLLRARPLLDSARETGAYLVRVAFGSALVASLAIVWLTIIAILSSSQSDDRNNGCGT